MAAQLARITARRSLQWNIAEASELARGAARKPLPDLDLTCTKVEGRWHHEDPRGDGLFETPTTEHYRFADGSYRELNERQTGP